MAIESTAEVVAAVVGALENLGQKYGTEAWSLSVQAAQSVGYFNIVTCCIGIGVSVGLGFIAHRIASWDNGADIAVSFFAAIVTGLASALVAVTCAMAKAKFEREETVLNEALAARTGTED